MQNMNIKVIKMNQLFSRSPANYSPSQPLLAVLTGKFGRH